MKRRWYLCFGLLALLSALGFFFFRWDGSGVFAACCAPLIWLGRGLRSLSLAGSLGNLAAWGIYLVLGLAPLGWLLYRLLKKTARWEDWILPVVSAVVFWGLYYLINPTLLASAFAGTDMGLYWCAQAIEITLLSWIMLRLLGQDFKHPEKLLAIVLNVCAGVLVFAAFGMELGGLLQKLEEVAQGNTAGDLTLTKAFLILRYCFSPAACLLDLWLIRGTLDLLDAFSRDAYSQEALDAAGALTRRGILALRAVIFGSLGLNLIQILAGSRLHDARLDLSLPLGSIALILAGTLLCRLLIRGKSLQDDSDLFV